MLAWTRELACKGKVQRDLLWKRRALKEPLMQALQKMRDLGLSDEEDEQQLLDARTMLTDAECAVAEAYASTHKRKPRQTAEFVASTC